MSEYKVKDFGCISDAVVYGLDESIKRAKYPMSTDVSKLNEEMTNAFYAWLKAKRAKDMITG